MICFKNDDISHEAKFQNGSPLGLRAGVEILIVLENFEVNYIVTTLKFIFNRKIHIKGTYLCVERLNKILKATQMVFG